MSFVHRFICVQTHLCKAHACIIVASSVRVSAIVLKVITILIYLMHSNSKYDFWAVRRVYKLQINVSPLPYSTWDPMTSLSHSLEHTYNSDG